MSLKKDITCFALLVKKQTPNYLQYDIGILTKYSDATKRV